ncbi:hypothetical protein AB0M79_29460 [Polymorphospora sp. NPDC051019]
MGFGRSASVAVAVVAGLVAALGGAAPAAARSGYGYDNQDPYDSGCASSMVLLQTVDIVTFSATSVGTG